MLDDLIELVTESGFQSTYAILVILILRPMGLCYGFIAFTWAMRAALTLRISISIALALPVLAISVDQVETLITAPRIAVLAPLSLKEFAIGFGLGFLASLPFFALQYAGAITDTFRGENDTGLMDPQGGMIHTFSIAYLVVGFFAFFSLGGLWRLTENLYLSYLAWPIDALFPVIDGAATLRLSEILMQTLRLAIELALPLLGLLIVIEISVSVAARLARRFNFYDMAFPIRNLAALLTLPLVIWLIWVWSENIVGESGDALAILRLLLP